MNRMCCSRVSVTNSNSSSDDDVPIRKSIIRKHRRNRTSRSRLSDTDSDNDDEKLAEETSPSLMKAPFMSRFSLDSESTCSESENDRILISQNIGRGRRRPLESSDDDHVPLRARKRVHVRPKETIGRHRTQHNTGKNACNECGRTLPAFGHARRNGKDHPDWRPNRYLHKKCWVQILMRNNATDGQFAHNLSDLYWNERADLDVGGKDKELAKQVFWAMWDNRLRTWFVVGRRFSAMQARQRWPVKRVYSSSLFNGCTLDHQKRIWYGKN